MRLTYAPSGAPRMLRATSVQVSPPSRLTCTLPSSVPTHSTWASSGDSATADSALKSLWPSFFDSMGAAPFTPMIVSVSRSMPRVRSCVPVHVVPWLRVIMSLWAP